MRRISRDPDRHTAHGNFDVLAPAGSVAYVLWVGRDAHDSSLLFDSLLPLSHF